MEYLSELIQTTSCIESNIIFSAKWNILVIKNNSPVLHKIHHFIVKCDNCVICNVIDWHRPGPVWSSTIYSAGLGWVRRGDKILINYRVMAPVQSAVSSHMALTDSFYRLRNIRLLGNNQCETTVKKKRRNFSFSQGSSGVDTQLLRSVKELNTLIWKILRLRLLFFFLHLLVVLYTLQ